jgi:hypothetical protein
VTTDFDEVGFARVVGALRPYLDDLVFVGGWAHRLFRLHRLAQPQPFRPLMTMDADIAAPASLRPRSASIRQLLLEAKFKEEFSGDQKPPRTAYRLGEGSGEVYVQFLTPLRGGELRRDGSPDATVTIQGVTAEKLRHLELLLVHPWTVELTASRGYPLGPLAVPVKICNPVSYLAQKLRTLSKRSPDKRGKDVLYIHDTILLFGGALDDLRLIWTEQLLAELATRARRQVVQAPERLFSGVTDAAREAASIARATGGRAIEVEELAAVCRRGLSEIFVA